MRNNAAASKERNRAQLIAAILRGPVSRAGLAKRTGLTRAAVSVIIDRLIQDGIVEECGTRISQMGRRPVLLRVCEHALYSMAADITRTRCSIAVCSLTGGVIASRRFGYDTRRTAGELAADIAREAERMLAAADIAPGRLLGMGITTPGPVDSKNGVILEPPGFAPWHGFAAAQAFQKRLGLPVYLQNNAIARAAAENLYGYGRQFENFILLTVKNGVGCGIVAGGKVFRGGAGDGCEIGHTTIDLHGERCYCGNVGCLEHYVNLERLTERARRIDPAVAGWEDIVSRARLLDGEMTALMRETAEYLAAGIVQLVNLFEPQAVILSGDLACDPALFLEMLEEQISGRLINRHFSRLRLMASELNREIDVIAAGTVVFGHYLYL